MAEKLNKTGLSYFYNRIKNIFATQSDLNTLSDRVDDIVAEGGEPNVIESVKVNGTALTPDAQKAVDVTVPTKVSDLTNDGDGTTGSAFATESYVNTNGGKIDKIYWNGKEVQIENKIADLYGLNSADVVLSVNGTPLENQMSPDLGQANFAYDIPVPTTVSSLTNDSGYQTAANVSTAIDTALANSGDAYQTETDVATAIAQSTATVYSYQGSVATYDDLPDGTTVVVKTGSVYDVQSTGMNYAWNGTAWDALGQYVDTSALWSKTELVDITTAEIDAIIDGE